MNKEMRNLIVFFGATFVWTWAFYTPLALTGNSPYQMPWMILLILGGAGPSIVGVALVLLTYDRDQRRDYWRRCFSFRRITFPWWLVIFGLLPAVAVLSAALDVALGGTLPGMEQLRSLVASPVMWPLAVFLSFMSGPWSEEFGWRGYVLDPIIRRYSVLPGSVVLGLIWGVWHLPLFFMPATWHGQLGFGLAGFWTFMLHNVGLALVMTWVYRYTSRSILSGLLIHFAVNFSGQLLAPLSARVDVLRAVLLLVLGLAGCWLLTRRPGQPNPQPVVEPQPGQP